MSRQPKTARRASRKFTRRPQAAAVTAARDQRARVFAREAAAQYKAQERGT